MKWKGQYLELELTWRKEIIFYLSEMSAANRKTTKLRKNQRKIQTWRQKNPQQNNPHLNYLVFIVFIPDYIIAHVNMVYSFFKVLYATLIPTKTKLPIIIIIIVPFSKYVMNTRAKITC